MWGDPSTGDELHTPPDVFVDGVPVLMADARRFVARHAPSWAVDGHRGVASVDPLPVDAPDLLTPHLSPGRWPESIGPRGIFGEWVRGLGDRCPDAVCAEWGADFAPDGVAVDAGCGVGGMARRMAQKRSRVLAFDRSPRAVLLARALLSGDLPEVGLLGARSERIDLPWPHPPVPNGVVHWAIADILEPPLIDKSIAWLHLGAVVDMVPAGMEAVLESVVGCLQPGGLLTIASPHDEDEVGLPGALSPDAVMRAVLRDLGLHVVDEASSVPWVVRQYDRGYRVLLTDCLAARAPG